MSVSGQHHEARSATISVEKAPMQCNQCSKEIPVEAARWTQDLSARSVVFCSDACQEIWIDGQFLVRLKAGTASAAATGQENASPN
jgi:hypothetical protein